MDAALPTGGGGRRKDVKIVRHKKGVISYGLSSYGYDIRIADEFKIFSNINATIVDDDD